MPVKVKKEIIARGRAKEKKIRRAKMVGGFLLTAVMVAGFVFILNLAFFRVSKFSVSGKSEIAPSKIIMTCKETVAGRYLWLVPKDNVFFINKKNFKRDREGLQEK